jgi:hypothetical protein
VSFWSKIENLRRMYIKMAVLVRRMESRHLEQQTRTLRDFGPGQLVQLFAWRGPVTPQLLDRIQHPIPDRSAVHVAGID